MSRAGGLVVLQLVANRWWTGSADPVIQLSRGLQGRGHRVLLGLIPGDRFETKAREAGLTPLAGLSLRARPAPGVVSDTIKLRRLVARERVDVVHTHHSHDHWLGWLCRGEAALVRSFHSARAVSARWPTSRLYRRSDALIAVSDGIRERCRAVGASGERVFRVDGVTDVLRFAAAGGGERIRKEFGLGPGPVVGSVSRLAPRRGHEPLIRGFGLLLARHPDARLLLVGKGETRARLEALVRDLRLDQHVLFAGYRDLDLPAVLDALDVFVLMGTGSDESGRAALEAMAAGRPVLARRVGALGDAVLHGSTGLLLEDDRPESVAAALAALVEDPARARVMGEAGRQRALSRFTREHHAAQVETIYRDVIARRAPAAERARRPG
jgi:L-malate glycosyltransferase